MPGRRPSPRLHPSVGRCNFVDAYDLFVSPLDAVDHDCKADCPHLTELVFLRFYPVSNLSLKAEKLRGRCVGPRIVSKPRIWNFIITCSGNRRRRPQFRTLCHEQVASKNLLIAGTVPPKALWAEAKEVQRGTVHTGSRTSVIRHKRMDALNNFFPAHRQPSMLPPNVC